MKTLSKSVFAFMLFMVIGILVSSCGGGDDDSPDPIADVVPPNGEDEGNDNNGDDTHEDGNGQKSNGEGDDDVPNESTNDSAWPNRGPVATRFAGGDGSKSNPYLISTAEELRKLADDVEKGKTYRDEYFKLTADIKINNSVISNTGDLIGNISKMEQWKPIGKDNTPFCGTFDGNNHTISGIYICQENSDSLGVFGLIAAKICNLSVKDSYIKGRSYIGGIIGLTKNYQNTYLAKIDNCRNYGTVISEQTDDSHQYVGGIVGYTVAMPSDSFYKCVNYGKVKGHSNVGGVAGWSKDDPFDCVNLGTVEGVVNTGGICGGISTYSRIYNSCNIGTVNGTENTGGIVGTIPDRHLGIVRLSNVVNYGDIESNASSTGAIIGYTNAIVECLYYLETSYSNWYGTTGKNHEPRGTIKNMTEKQMKSQTLLNELNNNAATLGSSYSRWIFGNDDYPVLDWLN